MTKLRDRVIDLGPLSARADGVLRELIGHPFTAEKLCGLSRQTIGRKRGIGRQTVQEIVSAMVDVGLEMCEMTEEDARLQNEARREFWIKQKAFHEERLVMIDKELEKLS